MLMRSHFAGVNMDPALVKYASTYPILRYIAVAEKEMSRLIARDAKDCHIERGFAGTSKTATSEV